jgi:hypothetical protein
MMRTMLVAAGGATMAVISLVVWFMADARQAHCHSVFVFNDPGGVRTAAFECGLTALTVKDAAIVGLIVAAIVLLGTGIVWMRNRSEENRLK